MNHARATSQAVFGATGQSLPMNQNSLASGFNSNQFPSAVSLQQIALDHGNLGEALSMMNSIPSAAANRDISGNYFSGETMNSTHFHQQQPLPFPTPEVFFLQNKILELSKTLAVEIETHRQADIRNNGLLLQLKKSSMILQGTLSQRKTQRENNRNEERIPERGG